METPAKSTASAQFPSQIARFLNARHKHTRHQARRLMKVHQRERRARRAFISPRFSEFFIFFLCTHRYMPPAFIGPHYLFPSLRRSFNVGRRAHAINFSKISPLM